LLAKILARKPEDEEAQKSGAGEENLIQMFESKRSGRWTASPGVLRRRRSYG